MNCGDAITAENIEGLELDGWHITRASNATVAVMRAENANSTQILMRVHATCPNCDPIEMFSECHWCGGWIDEDYEPGIRADGEYICLDCYEENGFHCGDCDNYHHTDCIIEVDGDRSVCQNCADENYLYCESCQVYTSRDNIIYLDDFWDSMDEERRDRIDTTHEHLCNYCAEDSGWILPPRNPYRSRNSYGINSYSYVPSNLIVHDINSKQTLYDFTSFPRGRNTRVYGWELEIESTGSEEIIQSRAAEINAMEGGSLFYCKSDSSVRNGYEIVSHPGTYNFWSGPGRDILEPLFSKLTEAGYTSWRSGRCGLHIHTNRSAITKLHSFNLARYVHDKNCVVKLRKLSGRSSGQALAYANLSLEDTFDRHSGEYRYPTPLEYAKQIIHTNQLGDRGRALNMSNPRTIELRLFRGSLKISKFISSLQFYQTMLEFTNPTLGYLPITSKIKWLDYRNFIEDYHKPKAVTELKAALQEAGI